MIIKMLLRFHLTKLEEIYKRESLGKEGELLLKKSCKDSPILSNLDPKLLKRINIYMV